MVDFILLKSQKNEILRLIKEVGLDPFNFEWSIVNSNLTRGPRVSEIAYSDSEFFFKFDMDRRQERQSIYSPSKDRALVELTAHSWYGQSKHVEDWVSSIRREVNEPDLWAEISKYQLPPESHLERDISNEQFSYQQVEQILSGLKEVRLYIEKHTSASEKQMDFITERLEYLAEAVKRQGRKDWIHTCIGVIVTIATALSLSKEQTETILLLIKNAVTGIIPFLPK